MKPIYNFMVTCSSKLAYNAVGTKKIQVMVKCVIDYNENVKSKCSANRTHVEKKASELRKQLKSLYIVSL